MGSGSTGACTGNGNCAFTCSGPCEVTCPGSGDCTLACPEDAPLQSCSDQRMTCGPC
ncbi:MAG: hypothetical protein R6X02_00830 [Enhygromyxa sp.]